MAYRIFVTDALCNIAKNTAKNGGEYPAKRFIEHIKDMESPPETRTEAEIIESIREKLRRLNNGGNSI